MRTVHCSGRPGGGVYAQGGVYLEGVSPQGVGGVCPGRSLPGGSILSHPYPVDSILDTHLWKLYLSATTVADGNNHFVSSHVHGEIIFEIVGVP